MSSYGQELLRRYLTLMLDDEPYVDYRPDWLCGMEIDLFYPAAGIAVEFQGDQHYIPVYGVGACISQKQRDRSKKEICEQRGIPFMRVEAIDLEYTRLFRIMKKAVAGRIYGLKKFVTRKSIRPRLRAINAEAIQYRKTLNENFGAITSRKKGYRRRLAKYEWLKSNGFYCCPIITPAERRAKRKAKREATLAHKAKLAAQGLSMLPA